ncbi:helix-turn-helix transcriptional regulator [Corynebacterium marquesiae]|uniref:ArsR/SmtB family transcription factor n=1 Tax=Corynebacterium marquesiae TaxID=2913503 RepID=UPI0018E15B3F|nr:winged helix-turn-helix domain-containing protein [Corynebacterium marquesiae]MDK8495441.1 winged helix-turn-helix domain-containing protein [Corynebacterium marquesiae]QQA99838.1 winged helix-turn-helix transcriptional regulator [Corynebacterium tuberculostearicum]
MESIESRVSALEERVAKLEQPLPAPVEASAGESTMWLADALEPSEELPKGSVIFGGNLTIGESSYIYQWQRPTEAVTHGDWSENLDRLAALAHPIRGDILRRLLTAPASATELVEEEIVTSTGTAYHHLSALTSAGWATKTGGKYALRPARVVPLLTIITASEAH